MEGLASVQRSGIDDDDDDDDVDCGGETGIQAAEGPCHDAEAARARAYLESQADAAAVVVKLEVAVKEETADDSNVFTAAEDLGVDCVLKMELADDDAGDLGDNAGADDTPGQLLHTPGAAMSAWIEAVGKIDNALKYASTLPTQRQNRCVSLEETVTAVEFQNGLDVDGAASDQEEGDGLDGVEVVPGRRTVFVHWDDVRPSTSTVSSTGRLLRLDRAGRIIYAPPARKEEFAQDRFVRPVLHHCGAAVKMVRAAGIFRTEVPRELLAVRDLHDRFLDMSGESDLSVFETELCCICSAEPRVHACPVCSMSLHIACFETFSSTHGLPGVKHTSDSFAFLRGYPTLVGHGRLLCPACLKQFVL